MKTIALRRQFAKYCIYIVSFWGRLHYRGLEDPKTIFGSSRKLLLHRLCNLQLHRHFWIYSFGFVNTVTLSNFYRLIWSLIRFASINPRYSPHHSGGFRVLQTWGSLFYLVFRYRPRIAGPWLELSQDSHSRSIICFTVQCWWLTTIHSVDFWDSETEMSAIVLGISGKISGLDKKGVGVFLLKGSKSRAL